jgi:hypothetical protein
MRTICLERGVQEKQKSGLLDFEIDELIEAWELARCSYQKVLVDGVNRSDIALAHDKNYNTLLLAGRRIFSLGGASAVASVAHRLGKLSAEASTLHFERLWQGMLPANIGRTN